MIKTLIIMTIILFDSRFVYAESPVPSEVVKMFIQGLQKNDFQKIINTADLIAIATHPYYAKSPQQMAAAFKDTNLDKIVFQDTNFESRPQAVTVVLNEPMLCIFELELQKATTEKAERFYLIKSLHFPILMPIKDVVLVGSDNRDSGTASVSKGTNSDSSIYLSITNEELNKNPSFYNHKRIKYEGIHRFGWEVSSLDGNQIWLVIPKTAKKENTPPYPSPGDGYPEYKVTVFGILSCEKGNTYGHLDYYKYQMVADIIIYHEQINRNSGK